MKHFCWCIVDLIRKINNTIPYNINKFYDVQYHILTQFEYRENIRLVKNFHELQIDKSKSH